MLRDIGLTRADVVDCLSSPLEADPSRLLIARINERRRDAGAARKAAIAANDIEPVLAMRTRSRAA